MAVSIVIRSVLVQSVTERFDTKWVCGLGKEAIFRKESMGWYIRLEDSWEALFVGYEEPNITAGDRVKITITKE
jgi:hypothetical protein